MYTIPAESGDYPHEIVVEMRPSRGDPQVVVARIIRKVCPALELVSIESERTPSVTVGADRQLRADDPRRDRLKRIARTRSAPLLRRRIRVMYRGNPSESELAALLREMPGVESAEPRPIAVPAARPVF